MTRTATLSDGRSYPAPAATTSRPRPPRVAYAAREAAWALAHVLRRALIDDERAWVSNHLWVPVAGGLERPDVAVMFGEPPADGVMTAPPSLVVEHHAAPCPTASAFWLEAGVREVWTVGVGQVIVQRGGVRGDEALERYPDVDACEAPLRLRVPGSTARVAVPALTALRR
jgi:hypothetical protein